MLFPHNVTLGSVNVKSYNAGLKESLLVLRFWRTELSVWRQHSGIIRECESDSVHKLRLKLRLDNFQKITQENETSLCVTDSTQFPFLWHMKEAAGISNNGLHRRLSALTPCSQSPCIHLLKIESGVETCARIWMGSEGRDGGVGFNK